MKSALKQPTTPPPNKQKTETTPAKKESKAPQKAQTESKPSTPAKTENKATPNNKPATPPAEKALNKTQLFINSIKESVTVAEVKSLYPKAKSVSMKKRKVGPSQKMIQ